MLKVAAVAAIFAATVTPALAVDIPSCDAFHQRFESAPRILSLRQMKPPNLSREPQDKNGDELYSFDDDESGTESDLTCRNGKFFSLEMMFHDFQTSKRPFRTLTSITSPLVFMASQDGRPIR